MCTRRSSSAPGTRLLKMVMQPSLKTRVRVTIWLFVMHRIVWGIPKEPLKAPLIRIVVGDLELTWQCHWVNFIPLLLIEFTFHYGPLWQAKWLHHSRGTDCYLARITNYWLSTSSRSAYTLFMHRTAAQRDGAFKESESLPIFCLRSTTWLYSVHEMAVLLS